MGGGAEMSIYKIEKFKKKRNGVPPSSLGAFAAEALGSARAGPIALRPHGRAVRTEMARECRTGKDAN